MSHNEPGPYGQPQEPPYGPHGGGYQDSGAYGQQQEQQPQYDPYGSGQDSPYGGQDWSGYGYPQSPPPQADHGYGQGQQGYGWPQQDTYGYPQQPGGTPGQTDAYGYPQQDAYGYPQRPAEQPGAYGYPAPPAAPPEQPEGYGYPAHPPAPPETPEAFGWSEQPPAPPQQPPFGGQHDPYGEGHDPYGDQQEYQKGSDGTGWYRGNGKMMGIAAAAVFLLVIVGSVVYFGEGSGGSGGGYTLATPKKVIGGEFTKDPSKSSEMPKSQKGDDAGISDATSVSAVYTNEKAQLSFGGAYGDVSDPDAAVDRIIAGGPFKDAKVTQQKPTGFDGKIMKCGELDMSVFTTPFCVWGDSSTAALVMYSPTPKAATGGSISTPSVKEWAQTTAKFRKDVRVKK